MQSGVAMYALHCLHHLPQDELGVSQLKDKTLPVGSLEAACCLPARRIPTLG